MAALLGRRTDIPETFIGLFARAEREDFLPGQARDPEGRFLDLEGMQAPGQVSSPASP